ncbi:MAG: A24 family peptidase [Silvanigrellaceae bacterium]|nr:A24 family peptidase [Silvanigrellaceae bacterium]
MFYSPIKADQAMLFFLFLVGACVGSFLNLSAYRIPLQKSILLPKSHCENCQTPIHFLGLIPIFGYFLLQGKCSACKNKISLLHPTVEMVTALGTVFLFSLFYSHGVSASYIPFLASLWLFYTGIVLSIIDLNYRILPDAITLPGIVVGFVLSSFHPWVGWLDSLLGILLGFFGLYSVAKAYELLRGKTGIGFGDIKYLAFLGAVVGWEGVLTTILLASITGSIIGIAVGIINKKGLNTAIPFGPFLALGGLLTAIYQSRIHTLF